jgi:hypothetical protein
MDVDRNTPVPGADTVPTTPEDALRLAAKLAIDGGDYERAGAIVGLLRGAHEARHASSRVSMEAPPATGPSNSLAPVGRDDADAPRDGRAETETTTREFEPAAH